MAARISSSVGQSSNGAAPATAALTFGRPFANANSSLYVGDLERTVTEAQLFDLFNQVGRVISVRICRDLNIRSSLNYGYVNFLTAEDAAKAKEVLNSSPINEIPIHITFSERDPSVRYTRSCNVFIKNLDKSIDHMELNDIFATFGSIISCKVALDGNGRSKGYGFVLFENEESAKSAVKEMHGTFVHDRQVHVEFFLSPHERAETNGFTNVFVKNLSERVNDEGLKQLFGTFGTITSAIVMKDASGKSRCFGFVNFQSPDCAADAVEKLNGVTINDKVLFVGKAQTKAERASELRVKLEQKRVLRYEKEANLYLKNLDYDFNDDEKLKGLFSKFGTVTSCKVMLDSHGRSKGFGFVAFSTPEEANIALKEMHGKLVGKKYLSVAMAHRKEERLTQLQQAHFGETGSSSGLAPRPAAEIHGYHPGALRLASQPRQGTSVFIPSRQPRGAPNSVRPHQPRRQQGQNGQRIGARRNGNLQHVQQNQIIHHNSNQRSMANNRNDMDSSGVVQGLAGPMSRMTFDGSSSGVTAHNQLTMSTSLASALASATPENQRIMLGEHLYPLVDQLTPNQHTAKVTGMLLEMDQSEVIHLIESPDDLKTKVSEALRVLQYAALDPELFDQLGWVS